VNQRAYMPVRDVATALGLSEARTYALIAEGKIPAVRDGRRVRVPSAAFEAWLRSQEQKALENLRQPLELDGDVAVLASVLTESSPIAPHERAALDSVSVTEGGQGIAN
jgi:excisionase family DNA binding protein